MQYLGQRVLNFRPSHSAISRFQYIAYFTIFPLTLMLKFQSASQFYLLTDRQKSIYLA